MSSSAQVLIPQLQLGNTFGALFIGVTLAAILFGLSNIQAFFYFQTHRGTGISFLKLAVAWLWTLDTLHLFLIAHCVYYYLVAHYADMSVLTEIVWSFKLQVAIDVIIIYGVHLLYFHRIWIVGKGRSRVLPIVVGVIVTLGSGVAITLIWAVYQCRVFSDLIALEWATLMSLGTVAFIDFVIASSLCYLLATSRTGFSSTDFIIAKLMAYIINTGCLTRYSFFQASPHLGSYFMQHVFTDSFDYIHMRYSVYRPELNVMASQDEEFQGSRKNIFKHPGDDVMHLTRSAMPHISTN
ncbi:uncharacterized protein BJ212DRAFT_1478698 [Suillus subaureus]|uniref:DUF6534 domain-containing protein n=1 Tax=Suillus subaureus TaxID=48587 RepID=A0A9P7EG57_9AGAM|nr:uncharacterized protein BJ212DRAFT_1478698 [Suillus subaureus]KAG1820599.1 hypothetical protein BJ212DRAFT_1478698 [Suillus subaureus]